MMTNETWVYTRGIIRAPREHINVFSEEFNQLLLLLQRQFSSNLKELLRIVANNYLFQILAFHLVGWSIEGQSRGF